MAGQSAQQTAPAEAPTQTTKPAEQLTIAEMTRIMDVVSALRRERGVAQQQLNLDETKRLLRERLIETARVTGDKVSQVEIDVAIEQYFDQLHVFEAPKTSLETILAHVYVARHTIAKWAVGIGLTATLWWSLFSYGIMPGPARTERIAGELYGNIEKSVAAVESISKVPDLTQRIEQLREQAEVYRAGGNLKGLERVAAQIASQEALLKQEYTLQIMQSPESGIQKIAPNGNVSGYYLIVQAVAPDGTPLSMTVRDGETGEMRGGDPVGRRSKRRGFQPNGNRQAGRWHRRCTRVGREESGRTRSAIPIAQWRRHDAGETDYAMGRVGSYLAGQQVLAAINQRIRMPNRKSMRPRASLRSSIKKRKLPSPSVAPRSWSLPGSTCPICPARRSKRPSPKSAAS